MKNKPDAAGPHEEISEESKALCLRAMQLALEYDGAPGRCPHRNCRKTGRCHVRAEGESPVCRAGIPGHVAEQAGLMLAFLAEVDQEDAAQEEQW